MNSTPASCAADLVELAPVIIHEIRKTIRQEMDARISLVQAEAKRYADTAALFQALGGGWWHRSDVAPQVADNAKQP